MPSSATQNLCRESLLTGRRGYEYHRNKNDPTECWYPLFFHFCQFPGLENVCWANYIELVRPCVILAFLTMSPVQTLPPNLTEVSRIRPQLSSFPHCFPFKCTARLPTYARPAPLPKIGIWELFLEEPTPKLKGTSPLPLL